DATVTRVTAFSGRSVARSNALVNESGWGEGVGPRSCVAATGQVSFSGNAGGATQTGPSYWDDVWALMGAGTVIGTRTAETSTAKPRADAGAEHRLKGMGVLR